jgi:hypothetical protein
MICLGKGRESIEGCWAWKRDYLVETRSRMSLPSSGSLLFRQLRIVVSSAARELSCIVNANRSIGERGDGKRRREAQYQNVSLGA